MSERVGASHSAAVVSFPVLGSQGDAACLACGSGMPWSALSKEPDSRAWWMC